MPRSNQQRSEVSTAKLSGHIPFFLRKTLGLLSRSRFQYNDLTTAFMQVKDCAGSTMSDEEVRDELLPLTVTDYETLGDCLGWIW